MRSGLVIIVVSAIGLITGCNQVENQPVNDDAVREQLETLRVEVTEIRHRQISIMTRTKHIRVIQTTVI